VIPSMRPAPARDQYGRYLLQDPRTGQERSWTRATTIAHTLSDEFRLTQWKRRKVAEGLARRPELVPVAGLLGAQLAELEGDWRRAKPLKEELDALCDEAARAAGAEQGSQLGTDLHSLTEWADAGRLGEVEVPAELADDLQAYLVGMRQAGIECPPEYIERIVINAQVDSAGTFDRLAWVPARDRLVIADLKTQKTVDFGFLEPAIQFAEYAYADWIIDPASGLPGPMPEVDREVGLLLHLPVGKAELTIYEVDLVEGWAAAVHAYEARQFRTRAKAMGRRWSPPRADGTRDGQLLYLIHHAPNGQALEALWRDAGERWTSQHTEAARARRAELATAN
jgi:hypothetical protein